MHPRPRRCGTVWLADHEPAPKFELFGESPTNYFLKVVDAQITFETDAQGKATGLVLHQNGRDLPGKRAQ